MQAPLNKMASAMSVVAWAQANLLPELEMPEFTFSLIARPMGIKAKVGYKGRTSESFFPLGIMYEDEAREALDLYLRREMEVLIEVGEGWTDGIIISMTGDEEVVDAEVIPSKPSKEEPSRPWKASRLNIKPPLLSGAGADGESLCDGGVKGTRILLP